jgi:hypothetical protein
MKRKIYQGVFSVNITVTAYNEEEARDKLWEELDSQLVNRELWVENFVCDENEIEEISPHD